MLFTPQPRSSHLGLEDLLNRGPDRSFHIMWTPENRTRPGARVAQSGTTRGQSLSPGLVRKEACSKDTLL